MTQPNIKQIMGLMEKNFKEIIESKNSWGKNEISRAFDSTMNKTLIELYDSLMEK